MPTRRSARRMPIEASTNAPVRLRRARKKCPECNEVARLSYHRVKERLLAEKAERETIDRISAIITDGEMPQ